MARGTQLSELLTMLRAEIGQSTNSNLGLNVIETHKQRLRRVQERLYHDYDWPFVIGPYDVDMEAGERYYDLPVIPESIQKVERKWGGVWQEICYGIGADQYNSRDSDIAGQGNDPIERWQFYIHPTDDSLIDNNQFEAWPVPLTSDVVTVRFWGKRVLPPLISNTDKAILDDQLIILYAAATLVKEDGDRKMKLAEAESYYKRLKGRHTKTKMFVLGGEGGISKPYRPGPVRVAYTLD